MIGAALNHSSDAGVERGRDGCGDAAGRQSREVEARERAHTDTVEIGLHMAVHTDDSKVSIVEVPKQRVGFSALTPLFFDAGGGGGIGEDRDHCRNLIGINLDLRVGRHHEPECVAGVVIQIRWQNIVSLAGHQIVKCCSGLAVHTVRYSVCARLTRALEHYVDEYLRQEGVLTKNVDRSRDIYVSRNRCKIA
jgi:hypothetical protein